MKLDLLTSLVESEDSDLALNEQATLDVYGAVTTIPMQTESISCDLNQEQVNTSMEIFDESILNEYQITNYAVRDFLVKLFHLLENAEDLKILVELFSLKYAELLKLKTPVGFYLKMSKDYLITTMDAPFESSSNPWMNWGIMSNGKCLTANTSGFPRIGKECSLSDILETEVHPHFFLSTKKKIDKKMKQLSKYQGDQITQYNEIHPTLSAQGGNKLRGIGIQLPDLRIRTLTPKECERLQGFPDKWTKGILETQRYKTLGNAVTVNVIEFLGKHISQFLTKDEVTENE